jgi:ACS family hexuronate transporter-like MFS transporter
MKIPRMQWVVAALLLLATMINYADRLTLGVISVEVRREFSLTEQDYSHIVTLFMLAYAIMYPVSGYVVDRLGTRRGFAVFIFAWSLAQMLHAATVGKWSLGAYRFLLGLTEPANWPAAAKAVAEWFPPARRALGVGLFNAGSSLGSAMAPPMVAMITAAYGWRAAFVFTGSLGMVWLLFWLLLYQPPHRNRFLRPEEYAELRGRVRPPEETAPAARGSVSWTRVLAMRGCYTLVIARFFTDPVMYFVIFWLPEYLRKERQFDLEMVGKYAWVPFIFGDIGYIAGGWLSGKLMERGWPLPRARKFVMLLGALCLPVAIAAPMVPSAALAIAATCFLTLGHALWVSNLQTLPTDLFPANEVGTASGLTGMGGAIGGVLANLGTGYLVSRFSYAPVFLIAGLMHPLSCVIVYRMLPDQLFEHAGRKSVS